MRLSVSYIWFLLGLRLSRRWFHRKETIRAVTLAIFVASAYKTLVQYVRVGVPASWLRVRTPGFAIHAPESARRIAARNSSSLNGLLKIGTGPIPLAGARASKAHKVARRFQDRSRLPSKYRSPPQTLSASPRERENLPAC